MRRAAPPPAELEHSGPVFDRVRRLAAALFGAQHSAHIILLHDGKVWHRGDGESRQPTEVPMTASVVANGKPLWVEDARGSDSSRRAAQAGLGEIGFHVAVPIRLADGSLPGVLAVGGPEPRAQDSTLLARLQDLADLVADEWTRARAARAQELSNRERDAANSRLAGLVRSAPLLMAIADRELRLVDASPAWFERRGLRREETIGCSLLALDSECDPQCLEKWRAILQRALAGEHYENERMMVSLPGGGFGWINVRVAPWREASGEIAGVMTVAHDITRLIEAMEAATRSEERLKLAAEMASLFVWEMDYVAEKLVCVGDESAFFEASVSYEDLARDIWRTIDPRDIPPAKAAWAEYKNNGTPYRPEYRLRRKDGRELWAASAVKAVYDEQGRMLRLVGAMKDITARKAQERALIQAKNDAETASRAKSSFLATVSHEIRTPLNGLMGMAEAMARGELAPVQRERLEVIRTSSDNLLAILNDLLDLSKIEAGKLTLEDGRLDIGELVKGAFATFQGVAENKGLTLKTQVSRSARGGYRGDPMRVRQILNNLLSNALKFTEEGGVTVAVSRRGGALQIEVADTGIGMSAAQLQNLFRAFEQADASTSRRYGGTGLGLAICHDLVDLMGGAIAVRSRPGEGTCFTVRLPLAKIEAAPEAPVAGSAGQAAAADRPLRVLAAEDNSVNQLVLKTLLSQAGVEPVLVSDGRAAVEAWMREPWDVILMDVQMPVMDGPAATTEIRAREQAEGRRRTPIIALTANAMGDQTARYLTAGMDGHVAKPIAAGRLFAALRAALEQGGEDAAEAAA